MFHMSTTDKFSGCCVCGQMLSRPKLSICLIISGISLQEHVHLYSGLLSGELSGNKGASSYMARKQEEIWMSHATKVPFGSRAAMT